MLVNTQKRELQIKIVYYGPALSGKTTNIEQVFKSIPPDRRSDLTVMKTSGDRTLFFDYMQVELGKVAGFTPRINLYTVPGQVMYAMTRKIVLRGADAVIFVADSSPFRIRENLYSWRQLFQHLKDLNVDLKSFPIVVQWNKRDLPNAAPIPLLEQVLQVRGRYPTFEAIAIRNVGVKETLQATLKLLFKKGARNERTPQSKPQPQPEPKPTS
ncbi:MAG: gliding-motility protein MglA [Ardenticatenia bacterium]|nr:gliding-motility protein MglA [Ardenticatenia bacterium]